MMKDEPSCYHKLSFAGWWEWNRSETTSTSEVLETDGDKRTQHGQLDIMKAIVTHTQLKNGKKLNVLHGVITPLIWWTKSWIQQKLFCPGLRALSVPKVSEQVLRQLAQLLSGCFKESSMWWPLSDSFLKPNVCFLTSWPNRRLHRAVSSMLI